MTTLNEAVARIALEVHPDRINSICSALGLNPDENILNVVKGALGNSFSPSLIRALADALGANTQTSSGELSAMLRAASATASLAAGSSSVELVWTGPATGLVPIRHTAQVLTGLIDETVERLFIVSFVAFHVGNIVDAMQRAIARGVQVSALLEQSKVNGGRVNVDSFATLRQNLPSAKFYKWERAASDADSTASVHAKCAVSDGAVAFVTSANLSDAAMERNMELGLLLRGGRIPGLLDQHLNALVATKKIRLL